MEIKSQRNHSSRMLTMFVMVSLIIAVAFAGAALPARREAKVDPLVALRYE